MPGPTRGFDYWQKASRGDGRYVDPDTGKEIKFTPQSWELNGGKPRQSTGGRVPPAHEQLPKSGYKLAAQNSPCPEPGCEHGTIYYRVNGIPAIWDGGNIYLKE